MNSNENLIHIKLENEEALESRRQILTSEREFLQMMQKIKNYHLLRSKELDTKIRLRNKIRSLINDIRKLQRTLPKLEIPKILQKEEDVEIEKIKVKTKKKKYGDDIEFQLQEIQDKLNTLQNKKSTT